MSKKKQQEPPLHCQRRFKSLRSSLGERSLRLLETDQKSAKVTVAFPPPTLDLPAITVVEIRGCSTAPIHPSKTATAAATTAATTTTII